MTNINNICLTITAITLVAKVSVTVILCDVTATVEWSFYQSKPLDPRETYFLLKTS